MFPAVATFLHGANNFSYRTGYLVDGLQSGLPELLWKDEQVIANFGKIGGHLVNGCRTGIGRALRINILEITCALVGLVVFRTVLDLGPNHVHEVRAHGAGSVIYDPWESH